MTALQAGVPDATQDKLSLRWQASRVQLSAPGPCHAQVLTGCYGLPSALATHATVAYAAHTVSQTLYTIGPVPPRLDLELRRKAHEERVSLNEMALHALERGLGLAEEAPRHHDLDDLAGTWVDDPEFDRAVAAMDQVDPEPWR